MDDFGVRAAGQVRAVLGVSRACAALAVAGRRAGTWPPQRGMDVVVLPRYALPERIHGEAAGRGPRLGRSRERDDRSRRRARRRRTCCTPKGVGSTDVLRRCRGRGRPAPAARRLACARNPGSPGPARIATSCTACRCGVNVAVADEVLDGPRSKVIREAANRMVVQMAVLYRLLKG